MDIDIQTTTDPKVAGVFVAAQILKELELGKRVLWFVAGGSAINVALEVPKIISESKHNNLVVMLTDERYGPVGFADSNLQQLLDAGFVLPQAKIIPILNGSSLEETTENFNINLKFELDRANFKIGLFGVGADSHTAGILPGSEAVESTSLACGYKTEKFERITITLQTIVELDEAVVFMQGESKWTVLEDFQNKNIDIKVAPVQILKAVPELTIFTDYKQK